MRYLDTDFATSISSGEYGCLRRYRDPINPNAEIKMILLTNIGREK